MKNKNISITFNFDDIDGATFTINNTTTNCGLHLFLNKNEDNEIYIESEYFDYLPFTLENLQTLINKMIARLE